jgi:hypothetical protein
MAVGDNRYGGETTPTKAKRLERTTNVHVRVQPLVGFIDAVAEDMGDLENWVEWAKTRIKINRKLLDVHAQGGDIIQHRLASDEA